MIINFTKMHALGNDFVVIDSISQHVKLSKSYIKKIADRKIGIGCDQVIMIEPPLHEHLDFYYKIYNANGEIAEQCLNGVRCAARFVLDNGLMSGSELTAESLGGIVSLKVVNDNSILTILANISSTITDLHFKYLDLNINAYMVSVGNPHLICFINDSNNLSQLSQNLEDSSYIAIADHLNGYSDLFKQGVNIGFAKLIGSDILGLRVFERGSGETLACGTNAVAASIVGRKLNLIPDKVTVKFKLGNLVIELINNEIHIIGYANAIFSGKFKI